MSNKTVFIVFSKEAYFYPYESQCHEPVKNTKIIRFVYKLLNKLKVRLPLFIMSIDIRECDNIIITDSAFSISLIKTCLKYKRNNIKLYYMNTIDDNNKKYMKYFNNIYTFDLVDAKKYDMKYVHTPFSSKVNLVNKQIKYDTCFLGRAKERINDISKIYYTLEKENIKNKFMVLDSNIGEFSIQEFITYEDYLDVLSQSKCIVEVNKAGQNGCSLRFLESLFFKKKLITNNISIINDKYYNSKNVFILGIDDLKKLKIFIDTKYNTDYLMDLQNLDFKNWVNNEFN